jgi:hypothetical protein
MKLDFSEISKGFDSALLKEAQNEMVSGDEALRILSRIQPTPENREAIERFKAYAAANPIPRSMLENTVNQLDPYLQKNMQAIAENKARFASQQALMQNRPAAPVRSPGPTAPQPFPQSAPIAQSAAPSQWNPATPAPPPTAPRSLWKSVKDMGRRFVTDPLAVNSRAVDKLNAAANRRDMLIEIGEREGNPQAIQAAKDEFDKTLADVKGMREAAYNKLPELNARQDAVENQNALAKLKAKALPAAGVDANSEYNPLFSQEQRNRGTVQPTGANQVQPINLPQAPAPVQPAPQPATPMAPGLPAPAPAPSTAQSNKKPSTFGSIKESFNDGTWKHRLPFGVGDKFKEMDTYGNLGTGIKNAFGINNKDPNAFYNFSKRFAKDPFGTIGGYGKQLFNDHPLLVGGGGLLLSGLALNSLFGKKKERQFSPQGGGQNININLGGGAAPGMFGYHRAGVSSLGAPTGLTSNYGMDNKFGMDMVKHAGFVSNALGNVVKNRMANQAVDSLLQSKPNEQKPEQPTQEEIQIAVKNPEVLKLLENEQNKAYLNRLLSEK